MFKMERYIVKNQMLKSLIKFIWHFEAENICIHHKLLPTASIDLLLNLSEKIIYVKDGHNIIAPSFHINGLRNEHSFIRQSGDVDIYGISFYPYGLYPFVNQSLKDLGNKITDINTISVRLTEKFKLAVAGDSVQDIVENIENALYSELKVNNTYMQKVEIIKEFLMLDDNITIKSFCNNNTEILRQYFINHPQSIDKYTFLQNSAFTHWVKEKCSKMC